MKWIKSSIILPAKNIKLKFFVKCRVLKIAHKGVGQRLPVTHAFFGEQNRQS